MFIDIINYLISFLYGVVLKVKICVIYARVCKDMLSKKYIKKSFPLVIECEIRSDKLFFYVADHIFHTFRVGTGHCFGTKLSKKTTKLRDAISRLNLTLFRAKPRNA
jgi:hypothetical protein